MKHFETIILIASVWFAISCGGNRLRNNEKALAKQILTEEEQLAKETAVRVEHEKQLADSIAKLPKGFRFKEDRSIDPQRLPTVIDIAGNRTNPRKIKLSQLFNKVEYIRLEQDPDSGGFNLGFDILVSPNHIYRSSFMGSIYQFDLKGHFIQTVCKGNLQFTNSKGIIMRSKEQVDQFEGAREAFWDGNKLCYQYENRPAQKKFLMTFDDQTNAEKTSIQLPASVESKIQINGKGEIIANLKQGSSIRTNPLYLLGNSTMVLSNRPNPYGPPANFIDVISTSGDTLCEFKNNDPIKNFSKSVSRGVDDGDTYYFNGILHLRQAFNDTIYQLISPNRLIPKYVLSFGELGIKSANQGVDPDFSLKDKLIPESLLETNRYLFITYSKDYSCPNTAKKGTLKFSRLIYDKKNKTLTPIYLDEAPFIPEGKMAWPSAPNLNIENDLDGMPFNWPTSVTANGKPFSIISGEDLLKLKNQNLPVKNIRKNDRIIAIYH